ncbi:MAG: glutamine--fructose-6-phosphate transaminase (isomerizing) [Corallococcus sp.]|nr:glutamine--fructose-6-phosphate transaminase (isomerizing) [Corallococcus sp.]
MCGIFGTLGSDSLNETLKGLKLLEYRGYDSAGIATKRNGIEVFKSAGRVDKLKSMLEGSKSGGVTIGHTRWATHGKVDDKNAHPFVSFDGNFALVHNGIIENFALLAQSLKDSGVTFSSDTDSETAVHILAKRHKGNVAAALQETCKMLNGSFAFAVIDSFDDSIYAVRRGSPLCVGIQDGKHYVCSDVNTLKHFASRIAVVPEDTVVTVSSDGIFTEGSPLVYFDTQMLKDASDADDYMYKEINEIPVKIAQTFSGYNDDGKLKLDGITVKKLRRIYFVGCGTAYHSGLAATGIVRRYCDIDAYAVLASEYIYDSFPTDGNTLVVAISQSGETADTLKAVEEANKRGAITYAVTNVENSSICFCARHVTLIRAGAEVAVASTKAYNCQLVALTLMALDIARVRKTLSREEYDKLTGAFAAVPYAVDCILKNKEHIFDIAKDIADCSAVFFIGRKADLPTAQEGSLKLKEISYIYSEAYASGELKHGTLALMESGVAVIALSCDAALTDKCQNAVSEVVCRGAKAVVVSQHTARFTGVSEVINLPTVADVYYPIVSVVPLQLLAYYVAKIKGRDADKPRNLAKSVTVE